MELSTILQIISTLSSVVIAIRAAYELITNIRK